MTNLGSWEGNRISAGLLMANTGPDGDARAEEQRTELWTPRGRRAGRRESCARRDTRHWALTAGKRNMTAQETPGKITLHALFAKDHSCCGGDLHICKSVCHTYTEQSKK